MSRSRQASRRRFLQGVTAAGALGLTRPAAGQAPSASTGHAGGDLAARLRDAARAPVLRRDLFTSAVTVQSVELLRNGRFFLVRVRTSDGATGLAEGHADVLRSAHPILVQRIAPFFVGKDARDLDALIEGVYLDQSNYKWQGLPFWVCVTSVELAVLDLLGQVSGRSFGDLLGTVRRREIAVYRASSHRGNSPEEELAYLQKVVEEDGAKAIKFRLGGRMRYDETTTRRDHALIRMTRQAFGDAVTLYADGNGSYDVPKAIEIGRAMQDHGFRFYEEPVPFDYYEETKAVADALTIPIAGGEEEASLRQFRWMIETGVLQVVQPDLFYFGGMTRALRVARMAEVAGLECTPHMSGTGLGFLYAAHFASVAPAHGPHQEYQGDRRTPRVVSHLRPARGEGGRSRSVGTRPRCGLRTRLPAAGARRRGLSTACPATRPHDGGHAAMSEARIRAVRPDDLAAAYYICLKTGDHGRDGEPFYRDDPDALGRIFVGPYIAFEPDFGVVLEDASGVCGYAFGALDSRAFYERYEREWRPALCERCPMPAGEPAAWTRAQTVHSWYHQPDYFYPEPYGDYPSHMHIDLLERAQGQGHGRRMMEAVMARLREHGSPGAHLGVSVLNTPALGFYARLGFRELTRTGTDTDGVVYLGKRLGEAPWASATRRLS